MVRWGGPGITLVFCSGMIAMARWKRRLQTIAVMTLLSVTGYIVLRGMTITWRQLTTEFPGLQATAANLLSPDANDGLALRNVAGQQKASLNTRA